MPQGLADNTALPSLPLLEGARSGDIEAWQKLVFLFGPLVMRWCRQRGLNEPEAEEVARRAFRAALGGISRFKAESRTARFRDWLRDQTTQQIARRAQEANASTQAETDSLLTPRPTKSSGDDAEDARLLYRRLFTLLGAEFDQAVWLSAYHVVIEDQPPPEAAKILGLEPRTVYLAKARVLGRFRDILAELREIYS